MKQIKIIAFAFFLIATSTLKAQLTEAKKDSTVFTLVDKEAKFPGGVQGWKNYLETTLDANLSRYIKLKKGEKKAQQTVKVQFLVSKAGKISNVMAVNKDEVHPKLAKEAVRVIKEGPDWQPAEQNGRNVIYMAVQYITWQVEEE